MKKKSLIVFVLSACLATVNLPWHSNAAEVAVPFLSSAQVRIDLKAKVDQQIGALKIAIEESIPAYEDFLQVKADPPGDTLAEQNVYLNSTRARLHRKVAVLTQISAQISTLMNQLFALHKPINDSVISIKEAANSRPTLTPPVECPPGLEFGGESIWETGTVQAVTDGDTVEVKTCRGVLEVRQIGIQATETAKPDHISQCGADEATNFMRKMLPIGSEVQLRATNYASSNNYQEVARPFRTIFAKDSEGRFTIDVQAKLLSAGLSLWFPNSTNEYFHNLEYLNLLNSAAEAKTGLWSKTLCPNDSTPLDSIDLWVNSDSPLGNENAFGEYVMLHNKTDKEIDISKWSIRDTSLDLRDEKYAFESGSKIGAGQVLTVYLGEPIANYPLTSNEISLGLTSPILQNPTTSSEKFTGDGIYLMSPRTTKGGGNIRAWMHRPCIPNDCSPPDWQNKNSDGSTRVIPLPQTLSMALNPAKYARKVPDLTGLTAEQVTGALAALDLTAQIIDLSPNAGKSQRIVKDLLPKPGTNLPAGATVKVNVIVPDA
jgi:endonuclease YncB( thermonuclease family)